jgi:hypothetical protein
MASSPVDIMIEEENENEQEQEQTDQDMTNQQDNQNEHTMMITTPTPNDKKLPSHLTTRRNHYDDESPQKSTRKPAPKQLSWNSPIDTLPTTDDIMLSTRFKSTIAQLIAKMLKSTCRPTIS